MRQDFEAGALKKALEQHLGFGLSALERLAGKAWSLNFKAVRDSDGLVFVAKLTPRFKNEAHEKRYEQLTRHLAQLKDCKVTRELFPDCIFEFCGYRVRYLSWCTGKRMFPDLLTDDQLRAFAKDYLDFSAAMQKTDLIKPRRDGVALRQEILMGLGGGVAGVLCRRVEREMPEGEVAHRPDLTRVIHGDFHYGNFLFADGAVTGFFDLDEFRYGYPAEDIVRYVTCAVEHLRWYEFGRADRIARSFGALVAALPYSADEWRVAINVHFLAKAAKRVRSGCGMFKALNLLWRLRFYRRMRRIATGVASADASRPLVVKVLTRGGRFGCMPPRFAYSPRHVFVADADCRSYDWLVVYDEMPSPTEELACPREHTILATSEPVSVKGYSRAYTRQFGHLLTNRPPEAEGHPHYHLGRGYYKWFNDRSYEENRDVALPPKTKSVSAVCSAKQMRHTRHFERFRLLSRLAESIPEMEWYGRGVRPFGKKHEVMDAYKYHVAVENHIAPHHWSEKLADAFLCECLPFYAGDPLLKEVFPEESFIPIPIGDPDEAARIIREAMAAGEYEKRRAAVLEAKRLILTKYNFWAQVIGVIEGSGPKGAGIVDEDSPVVRSRKSLRWHSFGAAVGDLADHLQRFFGGPRR